MSSKVSLGSLYEQSRHNILANSFSSALKATNIVATRPPAASFERQLSINELVGVEQKIVTFGQFISGQSLGNELYVYNKTSSEQKFTLAVDQDSPNFPESVEQLLAPYRPEDLPFGPSDDKDLLAVNSQHKFNCWTIENPQNR